MMMIDNTIIKSLLHTTVYDLNICNFWHCTISAIVSTPRWSILGCLVAHAIVSSKNYRRWVDFFLQLGRKSWVMTFPKIWWNSMVEKLHKRRNFCMDNGYKAVIREPQSATTNHDHICSRIRRCEFKS